MPRIIVTTEDHGDKEIYVERVSTRDLESGHFSTQLIERVAWAVADAEAVEAQDGGRLTADRPA